MKLKSILLLSSAMLVFGNSFGQYSVTTGGNKYVLVEEATGPGCGFCPDGAQDIEEGIEATYPHAIIASWHGSYYDASSMVVSGDPFCNGTGYISGFPEAAIDRTVFPDPDNSNIPAVGLNRGWDGYVGTRIATTPNFDVWMLSTYNPTTKVLTVKVTGIALAALTGTWHINAYITEDSISSGTTAEFNQHSYMYSSYPTAADGKPTWWSGLCTSTCYTGCASCAYLPTSGPGIFYSHMNVVRAALASGGSVFGDAAFTGTIAKGATFTKTYTDTLITGTSSNPNNTTIANIAYVKVIGLVQKPGPASNTTVGANTIENCIQARVRLMPTPSSAVLEEKQLTMTDVTLYPNPAKNSITIKGLLNNPTGTKINVVNSAGQVVLEKEFPAGGSMFGEVISLDGLSNGIYFMNISNNGADGVVTKQFTVNK